MNSLSRVLIDWYRVNCRDLPWRKTCDPYKIWLSEIILQQTQVKTGLAYYKRIVDKYPDVQSLAASEKDVFMKLWQGLGYYRRAENMLKTAEYVYKHMDGKLPASYSGLLNLKGIGEYTAAAIASFAYNEAVPVIDGNVRRVISRLYDIALVQNSRAFENEIKQGLNMIFDKDNPADFNQAIMEFGALLCRKQPLCDECPLQTKCLAYKHNVQNHRPVKSKNKSKKHRHFYYVLIKKDNRLPLVRRNDTDIWRSLYEFPVVELEEKASDKQILTSIDQKYDAALSSIVHVESFAAHILTHQAIHAHVYLAGGILPDNIEMVNAENLHLYPVHRLMDKIMGSARVKSVIFPGF
ncbi:MAG: A/G-specific adenine glycosylase [Bacteroidales bacterium]